MEKMFWICSEMQIFTDVSVQGIRELINHGTELASVFILNHAVVFGVSFEIIGCQLQ